MPALVAALAVALGTLPLLAPASWTVRATLVCITAIGALGQNLLMGNAGLVSFGQAGFLAVGAYAFAHARAGGTPFPLAVFWAGLLSALVGAALGIPARRLKGAYLALATFGFAVAVYQALAAWEPLSGGRTGLGVRRLSPLFGLDRIATAYCVSAFCLLLFVLLTRNLSASWIGRAFVALRDSEAAAEAAGLSPARLKVLAFALSSFYAGVQGALLAQFLGHVEPQDFTVAESITLVTAVVVGGLGSLAGSLLGAAFVVLVPTLGGATPWFTPLVFGTSLLLVMLLDPGGLAGIGARLRVACARPR